MVFAARDSDARTFTAAGVESLVLGGLSPAAVQSLLAEHVGAGLTEEVAHRLLVETRGNPLALVAITANLSAGQLNGTAPLPAQLRMGANVEPVTCTRCWQWLASTVPTCWSGTPPAAPTP